MFTEAKNVADLDPFVRDIVREELKALLAQEKAQAEDDAKTKAAAKKKD